MKDEIKEILDKLSNRKQETLLQGIRECQLKDIEHPFITKEEYIDKILDYITTLQEENEKIRKMNKAKHKYAMNMEDKYITEKIKNQKAIEKINSMFNVFPGFRNGKTIISENLIEVLNILKGNDNK